MEYQKLIIKIDGREVKDIYHDILSVEVEIDDRMAAMFRIRLPMKYHPSKHLPGGTWSYLEDERLELWKKVSISAADDEPAALIDGYITHVKPTFHPDSHRCVLEIWGMDGSVLMDRKQVLKDWPNKKDSDIAKEILGKYGFKPEIDDTKVVHEENLSTIIQRETDMHFLKRLAERNGFETYVEGETAYFREPVLDQPPQPLLAYYFGTETTLNRLSIGINALEPANVAMFQVDRRKKEIIDTEIKKGLQESLGKKDPGKLLGQGIKPAQLYVGMNAVTGKAEMENLCRAIFHKTRWLVTAEGEIPANMYGHVLKTRRTVTIKGIGETNSGIYYVTHVTHSFTSSGYVQYFKAKRNALLPTGKENFED